MEFSENQLQDAIVRARQGGPSFLLLLIEGLRSARDAERLSQAMLAAGPRLWLELDVFVRRDYRCHQRKPVPYRALELLLDACRASGYVREAAVAAMSEVDDPVVLPVLALRTADWVPQVRDRARRLCRQHFDDAPARVITLLAPIAYAVRARRNGDWLANAVDELLRDGPPEALTAALSAEDREIRRSAYEIGVAAGRIDADRLVHAALTDPDLPTRLRCAKAAIRTGNAEVPHLLLASGTAGVRAEAVKALDEPESAFSALSDRSAVVRAVAQQIVRRHGIDPAARYRELLAAHQPPGPAVLAGLGETGTESDGDLLRPWLTHPTARGRAETIRALRRLGCSAPLLPLLTDASSTVTRQVTLSLRQEALDEQVLWPVLWGPHPPHVRRAVLRLLRAHSTWTRITADLRMLRDADPDLCTQARADLDAWLAREAATSYTTPQGAQADALSTLLRENEVALGADRMRLLRFHLGLPG
ncbi:hypothetical protein [Amycolatopsis albispora]|uniref:PBS lyase n=1 Tax=Amycolatopsis albispora TaxID=1804986 RepID=A0A344L0V5_9PSEU|nr:hypothetical protein [Amycolatopsis albispora]AXB41679.1 hypothetical protein A4R43_03400 [Amycolatopsis albispora]